MYTGLLDSFLGHAVFGSALQTYKSLSGSAYRPLVPFSVSLILLKYEYGLKMSEGEIMLFCQQSLQQLSHTDAGYGFEKISPQGDLFLIFFKIYLSVYFLEHII